MAVFCNSAYPMVLTGPFLPKGKQFDLGGSNADLIKTRVCAPGTSIEAPLGRLFTEGDF